MIRHRAIKVNLRIPDGVDNAELANAIEKAIESMSGHCQEGEALFEKRVKVRSVTVEGEKFFNKEYKDDKNKYFDN